MPTLTGILLDVSGSMKQSIGCVVDEEGDSWARSIFKVIDRLITHDVSSDNHVFALGVGASLGDHHVFDILNTINNAPSPPHEATAQHKEEVPTTESAEQNKKENLDTVLDILENHGAPRVRKWAKMDILMEVVNSSDASFFKTKLNDNADFRHRFVYDCLPKACREIDLGTDAADVSVDAAPAVTIGGVVAAGIACALFPPVIPFILSGTTSAVCATSLGAGVIAASGAVGIGGRRRRETATKENIIEVVEKGKALALPSMESILYILEHNGAPYVQQWAGIEIWQEAIEPLRAAALHHKLRDDSDFCRRFVHECLPGPCRSAHFQLDDLDAAAVRMQRETAVHTRDITDDVRDVVNKGLALFIMDGVGPTTVMNVHQASEILHGRVDEDDLTTERIDELMKLVDPFIYGGTPLIRALNDSLELLGKIEYQSHKKLLFILSDGEPADGTNPPMRELKDLGVTVVCCFITNDHIADPRHLFSTEQPYWSEPTKLMCRMSSTITTQEIPRTVFVKRGWTIDFTNNETRLFCQVNHPDVIHDVCDLARNVVSCQEALSDVLSSVDLDLYINKASEGFGAKEQVGGTCYANASAAVLHLAMHRIVRRDGGYPDFFALRECLIARYGDDGANTVRVLQEICPEYRLQCREVDVMGAMKAIVAKRPVIARFRLTDGEWSIFSRFFRNNPRGILSKTDLDITRRQPGLNVSGHAVVLMSFNVNCLYLMNSWGSDWADGGFFRISSADVLNMEFIDVFWTLNDLKPSEIEAYKNDGPQQAARLFSSLQGLQTAEYQCPICHIQSKVVDFSGHVLEAKCPRCHMKFRLIDAGSDLALNLYLTSLSI